MAERTIWSEAVEMLTYRSGQKVELKQRPGQIDTVIGYDPFMVPPVILANDPQPRYPEELTVISQPGHAFDWFNPLAKVRASSGKTAKKNRQTLVGSHR
jgi:hypothetical protein